MTDTEEVQARDSQYDGASPDGHVPAIAVRSLVKRFGELEAVRGVDFEVAPGEVFGFLGPNGAGKTTTINMLCSGISSSHACARC